MEVEYTMAKGHGGRNRISNPTIACKECNRKKGNRTAAEFGFPHIQERAQETMRDIARSMRHAGGCGGVRTDRICRWRPTPEVWPSTTAYSRDIPRRMGSILSVSVKAELRLC
ncbi:MAG: HNH endonuclease [Firmicutes bacterium]|nr:HNH endonuclease [Bacillota bacterium]